MDGLSSYQQKETYQNSPSFRALYQHNDELLRVEIRSRVELSQAQHRIDGQLAQVKTMFEKARAPYPGEVSSAIECGSEFLPVYDTVDAGKIPISRITAYLTDRLTYGACTIEQATYRSMLALFFCPTQEKLYQLEFIAPVGAFGNHEADYEAIIKSIRCR